MSKVALKTEIGGLNGANPLKLSMPVMIAPMSYGALSASTKRAVGLASSLSGIAENTGEGGMSDAQRGAASQLIFQMLGGRLGWNIHDMNRADGLEIYISQGAKPGLGGQLMAKKVTPELARIRGIPHGIDLRSPSRHPDILGGDDLLIKAEEMREATGYRLPVSVKLGAGRGGDDLVFLPANLSRLVIDPYREACKIGWRLGERLALDIPFFVAGFDEASEELKVAVDRGAAAAGVAYLGATRPGENAPWLQLCEPGRDAPSDDAAGVVYRVGERWHPMPTERARDGQILGLLLGSRSGLEDAIVYALERGFDLLVLDGTSALDTPPASLSSRDCPSMPALERGSRGPAPAAEPMGATLSNACAATR